MQITPLVPDLAEEARPARVVVFLSGSGSNAERVLELSRATPKPPFRVVALVTDSPQKSRATQIAETYGIPLLENDIRSFYRERGLHRVTIRTEEGRAAREAWTDAVREQLADVRPDFGVLAGFVPLTNLVGDFPCLNVHPGDLTVLKDGERHLIGLHTVPVERAMLAGMDSLRSSVILAEPYVGGGDNMDSGPLLGLSPAVPVDWRGATVEELRKCMSARPETRPKGGFGDALEELAKHNLTRLKENGDWIVLPRVVADVADGRFGLDEQRNLFYRRRDGRWLAVQTVIYETNSRELVFSSEEDQ
mgnify:CR=1 FL=1